MANLKFDQFTDGGECRFGDVVVGLRSSDLVNNYKFAFPGLGIKDVSGNYMLQYATAGVSAVNYPKLINSLTGTAVIYTAQGSDTDIDISIQPKNNGAIILDELTWPTSDGAAGTFIKTDGAGNLSFTSAPVVTDIEGTANQVLVNGTSGTPTGGSVILTTPQDIAPTSSVTFNDLTLSSPLTGDNGGTGLSSLTPNGIFFGLDTVTFSQVTPQNSAVLVTDNSGVPTLTPSLSNGQIVIGSTGGTPTPATLTAGTGISITNAAGSITIAASGGGESWTEVTGTSQSMAVDHGYIANNAGLVTLTIPASVAIGQQFEIVGKGAGGWLVQANTGQTIYFSTATSSVAGSIASSHRRDCVGIRCITANTEFEVYSSVGSPTVA